MNHVSGTTTQVPRSSLCAPSAVDNRSKKKEEREREREAKKTAALEGWHPTPMHRRIATAACGAAYGAWLPIVKVAAYLTDFMVDRIFRMNPG